TIPENARAIFPGSLTFRESALHSQRQDRQRRKVVCRTWCRDFAGGANHAAFRTHCIRDETKTFIHRLRRFTQIFRYESYNLRKSVKSADQIAPTRRPWYRPSLTTQIMIGLVLGALIGWLRPDWGNKVYFLRDIFINLIKSIIAPLVFSTIVVGIAGAGALKRVGRIGIKALIFFEIVTTAALFIGLAVVNFTKPGAGVTLAAENIDVVKQIAQTHPQTFVGTIVHAFPSSIIDAMARGDVVQIVAFSVLFALAVSAVGEKGQPIVRAMESLAQIMFKFTNYVMMFAPIGAGAAMAHTIGTQGPGVLVNLGKLILSLYLALMIFIVVVFGIAIWVARIPLRPFFRAVREPAALAFATTSSESALPNALESMERFGVPPSIVGFVMPTGYSFNLTGSTLYLAMASVFVAQAAETTMGWHMSIGAQITMM